MSGNALNMRHLRPNQVRAPVSQQVRGEQDGALETLGPQRVCASHLAARKHYHRQVCGQVMDHRVGHRVWPDDQTVDPSGEGMKCLGGIVSTTGDKQHNALAQVCGRGLEPHHQLAVVGAVKVLKDHPVGIAASRHRRPGPLRARVRQLAGGSDDPRPGRLRDRCAALQDPRDRRRRDPGLARDGVNRHRFGHVVLRHVLPLRPPAHPQPRRPAPAILTERQPMPSLQRVTLTHLDRVRIVVCLDQRSPP